MRTKCITAFLLSVVILLITLLFAHDLCANKKKSFIGYKACIKCHGNDAIGNQVAVWRASPHARAYRRLKSSEALVIGKKVNISEPASDEACLKCHNTGGGKHENTMAEGVSCEACHGPAGYWHQFENHVSPSGSKIGYNKAVSLGMYPIIGISGIKLREKMCKRCHTAERPCIPETITDKKKLELPLEFISDFIYKHPVRR